MKILYLTPTDVVLVMVPVARTADILIFLDACQEHVYAIIHVCFAKCIMQYCNVSTPGYPRKIFNSDIAENGCS